MKSFIEWKEQSLLSELAAVESKKVNWDYYYRTFGVHGEVPADVNTPVRVAVEKIFDSRGKDASIDELIIDAVNAVVYWAKKLKHEGPTLSRVFSTTSLGTKFGHQEKPPVGGENDRV